MVKSKKIHETLSKSFFKGPEANTYIQHFKDEIEFFEKRKIIKVTGKGVLCNRISEHILLKLSDLGIENSFIRRINMREQLIRETEKLPVFFIIRNIAAGSFAKRLGLLEGAKLARPVIEAFYRSEDLGNPMISIEHMLTFSWFSESEIEDLILGSRRINDILIGFFSGLNLKLIDMKVEFSRVNDLENPRIIFDQDISPDTCRLWEASNQTSDAMARDVFDSGRIYNELAKRLHLLPEGGPRDFLATTAIQ